ncbi:sialate O-acetylesterase [Haloferula rosea]|uniref:Sialate O-acetylesterase domain-containing protein n=1 Tax=Haloferula rosea TaxID=490093 RepID=A0A934RES2_9BACT|nr:sialate O-acetylesterase [Haloferula rosea]MBK1827859.1 hypothetical protein [Haloferula rosea]
MSTRTFSLVLGVLANLLLTGHAEPEKKAPKPSLKVAGIFADHMVLQQQAKAPIWGTATAKAEVTITTSWNQETTTTTTGHDGRWKTTLDTPSAGGPFQIQITSGSSKIQLKNVLIGEVWICSGQSNMQWKMRGFGLDHWKDDVAKAKHPGIRFCQVPQVLALETQDDMRANWSACTPQTVLNFSAVAYFFGSRLHQELDVPIGLISTNWGGSSAEAWISPEKLGREFPEFDKTLAGYPAIAESSGALYAGKKGVPKGLNQRSPAVLYNSMIHPLIPYAFRGVIWYQGESNVRNPSQYARLFPALIEDWRTRWGAGDFPFYFVQIAPFHYKQEPIPVAFLREAQMKTLSLPRTGMAVTMDVGDATNIHPKKKKPVAERLALMALARDYGRSDLVDSGPLYQDHEVQAGSIRIKCTGTGSGLASSDGEPLSHFTIAGKDRKFVPAEATIDGDTLIVSSDKVRTPVAVRFAWGNADAPNFANKEGLPASSFRTDAWPIQP